jgi:Na+(H+)/acetate symporter ActP
MIGLWLEVNMSIAPSIGLAELVILTGVTGLSCSVPLIGALLLAAMVLCRRVAHVTEQEWRTHRGES